MCEPQNFDFVDLNLDFLDITPPAPTQGAPNIAKCAIPLLDAESKQTIKKIEQSLGFRQNSKIQDLAKRIASTDLCMQHIQALQEERNVLQQQLEDLQSSANDVRRLYDEENQERKRLKCLGDKLAIKCDALQKDIANKTLTSEQLESELENIKRVPIEYNELVICFLRLSCSYDEEVKPLHKLQLDLVDKLKKYCKEHGLKTPELIKRSPKKRGRKPSKAEAGIQCELSKEAPLAESATYVPKEMRSQGTQHISTTTTRSTCTSTFIKKHNVSTSFPESSILPPVNDIVIEMLKWDIRPLSPIGDIIPAARVEDEKIKKSTGTCTKLCNIQRSIDYIGVGQSLLSSIKRSNSRPPSRNMFDSFKNELTTPPPTSPPIPFVANNFPHLGSMRGALSAATFEDLWQVFGQMLFGLLGNRPDTLSSAARSGNAQSQLEFYHWLRSLYADISEHQQQHEPPQQQQQQQREQPLSADAACINSSMPNEDNSQHTSIATSPIRPISPSSGGICKIIIPSQACSEVQNVEDPAVVTTSNLQTDSGLDADSKNSSRKSIVNDILKLFSSNEPSQETRKKLNKMLNQKRKRYNKQQRLKNQKDDQGEEKCNTFDTITPVKIKLSANVGNELREYSNSIYAISPIKDRIPAENEQQSEISGGFPPSKTEKLHAEIELQEDLINFDILSPTKDDDKYDDENDDEDDIKLENDKNCFISSAKVLQNQTNLFRDEVVNTEEQEDDIKETYDESTFIPYTENQTNQHCTDIGRTSVMSRTDENNIKDDYRDSNFNTYNVNEVSQNQADKLWNDNERTSVISYRENENSLILYKEEENIEHAENDIKDDYEDASLDSYDLNEMSQNQANELLNDKEDNIEQSRFKKDGYQENSFIPSTKYKVSQNQQNELWNRNERIGENVDDDYKGTPISSLAENEVAQNQADEFWSNKSGTSLISCSEEKTIEYPENEIKDDFEDTAFIPSIENEMTQNQQWSENGRNQILPYAKEENTEHIAGEVYVETNIISTPLNEFEGNQANELKVENDSAFVLPTLAETAVDFLSQLQLSSYSLAENETLSPFIFESPQSPTGSSSLNYELGENSMDNNESQSVYSAEHTVVNLTQHNNSKNSETTTTTCLMSTLFGSVTDSDSDDNIKDEFSAEEYKVQIQNADTNQCSSVINSLSCDFKINDVEVECLNVKPSLIKDDVSKCSLIETRLNGADAAQIHASIEEQIKEEDLRDFKVPKSLQQKPSSPQKMPITHNNANDFHTNQLPQWNFLQNEIITNAIPTTFQIGQQYQKFECNGFERQHNSTAMEARDVELENVPPCLVAEEEEADVEESLGYLEEKTNEYNLVIDEDYCNTSQDNNFSTDSTHSTNLSDERLADSSNEQNGKKKAAKRVKRKYKDVNIEDVQNQKYSKPSSISASKEQSSPAKEIRENLIKYEADSVAFAHHNSDDDSFTNVLNNILNQVEPRNVSPVSIISNSVSSAMPIKNDDVANQSQPKKRGRKRKIAVCPNDAPTAAIACKRSERLRVLKRVNETKVDTILTPLHDMATIKIGKYTINREDDYEKSQVTLPESKANITVHAEETVTLDANSDYFTERSKVKCDSPLVANEVKTNKTQNVFKIPPTSTVINSRSNKAIGYQDIFKSFADQHRKCLQKKKPTSWTAIQSMERTSKDGLLKPNVSFNCDIVKDELLVDHAAEQQYESPTSPDTFVSPASPVTFASPASPSDADSSEPSETKEIPLEPDPTLYQLQHSSLLQRLVANHSSSLHQLVVDTFNKKYPISVQTQLCLRIKNFLNETIDVDAVESAAIQLVQELLVITSKIMHITAAIVAEMQNVPRPEKELGCSLPDVPAKYLGKQHRRISFVMRSLQQLHPSFTRELMGHIESTLFNYHTNERLPLEVTLNLTQLYLLTLSICMSDMQKNPARLFVAKCLYFYNLKAAPMIYEVLCCFPTTLPHLEERRYDRSDALITVIQHILMSTKYDMDKQDLRNKELLSKLRFEYHFEPFKPNRTEVLTNIVEKIKSDKLENVSYALALFCKRFPQPKVETDILESQLMPLANEFYKIVIHSSSHDSRIACLLECISMVIKPFRTDTDIAIYMSLFSRFLNVVTRATTQEAAVRAIIRCQRFGHVNCYNELLNFKPCYELQPITKAMLKTFVYRKSAKFWRSLNTSAVNLTF